MLLPLTLLLAAVASTAIVVVLRRRVQRRRAAFAQVLDAADAFEARLRAVRAEIGAPPATEDDPARAALQEMLRQRLWLQQHGATADLGALDAMRQSIEAARTRIEHQLAQVAQARGIAAR